MRCGDVEEIHGTVLYVAGDKVVEHHLPRVGPWHISYGSILVMAAY